MSCVSKINHAYTSFNTNQKKIADYIITNPDKVVRMSVQELALKTDTSPAAIVRFSKKVGYDGYPTLKLELVLDVSAELEQIIEDQPVETDSFYSFLRQEQKGYLDTINQTFVLINADSLEKVIGYCLEARRIYITGLGGSSSVARDFHNKLTRIDAPAVFNLDAHIQLGNSIHLTPEDLVIAISYRGRTNTVNLIVQRARKRNIRTVAITQNNGSPLSKYAEIILPVYSNDNDLRFGSITSRNSSQVVTDLIYLGMIKNQAEKSSHKISKTREAIGDLQK